VYDEAEATNPQDEKHPYGESTDPPKKGGVEKISSNWVCWCVIYARKGTRGKNFPLPPVSASPRVFFSPFRSEARKQKRKVNKDNRGTSMRTKLKKEKRGKESQSTIQ
jgi:hypothetical protein